MAFIENTYIWERATEWRHFKHTNVSVWRMKTVAVENTKVEKATNIVGAFMSVSHAQMTVVFLL